MDTDKRIPELRVGLTVSQSCSRQAFQLQSKLIKMVDPNRKQSRKQTPTVRKGSHYYEELSSSPEDCGIPCTQVQNEGVPSTTMSIRTPQKKKVLLPTTPETARAPPKSLRRTSAKRATPSTSCGPPRKTRRQEENPISGESELEPKSNDEIKQCLWFHCMKPSQPGSKFCSKQCGVLLAKEQVKKFLPSRWKEWKANGSRGEQTLRNEIALMEQKESAHAISFQALGDDRQKLDEFIDYVRTIKYRVDLDTSLQIFDRDTSQVPCVTCGTCQKMKSYVKHANFCFVKNERNIVMEKKVKTVVPGAELFCNIQDKKTGTFCMRLASLCPTHFKSPEHPENAVCGAISSFSWNLDVNNICRAKKSDCERHDNWERIRRAEIDIRRVDIWTKMGEMKCRIQQLKDELSKRGNFLDILTHRTQVEEGEPKD